jgi:hypothetical protein
MKTAQVLFSLVPKAGLLQLVVGMDVLKFGILVTVQKQSQLRSLFANQSVQ